jgi:hypothetical protein
VGDGGLHHLVVVRMELDLVDAVAVRVVRAQPRPVAVGVERQRVQRVARDGAIAGDGGLEGLAALARQRFAQRGIVPPQVARRERRGWLSTTCVAWVFTASSRGGRRRRCDRPAPG